MKNWLIGIVISLLIISILIGLSYGFGWIGVHQTKTIGKEQENANREVFEQTQSYIEGKRQEALKFYQEYQKSNDEQKESIKQMVSHSFANFDENRLNQPLRKFVHDCKYAH
jgi:predicted PurR-regulated permease PerM